MGKFCCVGDGKAFRVVGYVSDSKGVLHGPEWSIGADTLNRARVKALAALALGDRNLAEVAVVDSKGREVVRYRQFAAVREKVQPTDCYPPRVPELPRGAGARLDVAGSGRRVVYR